MRILFTGSIGQLPIGGHACIQMQYLVGLRDLGHDVYYLEDCGEESWVYRWESQDLSNELDYPAQYVSDCLNLIELDRRWCFRAGRQTRGLSNSTIAELCGEADLIIVWAVPLPAWRPEYSLPRRRAFIDADPCFTQVNLAKGDPRLTQTIDRCETHFTIAQRIGLHDCTIPNAGRIWHKTLAPIALNWWPIRQSDGSAVASHFTCVLQWRGFREVEYAGVRYGQKDAEFPRFIDLPLRAKRQPIRLAVTGIPAEELTRHGWDVVPGWVSSRTPQTYQQFIQDSRGEFGIAKHGYVRSRGGWFSDRSVCYLASGRPVLVQDTGQADFLPTGKGVVLFGNVEEAVRGFETINENYAAHCAAARRIAEEHFDARNLLPALLDIAMN